MRLGRNRSLRTRMTLLASGVMTLLCLGICSTALIGLHEHFANDRTRRILLTTLKVVRLVEREELPPVLPFHRPAVIQVLTPRGEIAATNTRMSGRPRVAPFVPQDGTAHLDGVVCDAPGFEGVCLHVVAVPVATRRGDWLIYGAEPTAPWYISPSLVLSFLGGTVLLTGATAIGAYRTVGRSLDPVNDICAELAEITSSDLGRRVPVPTHRDEVRQLAEVINQTLDRLEAAVERERRFASDASHDLRSPITAMRTQVEEALMNPRESDWPAVAGTMLAGLGRLQAIVTDLLVISRLEAGAGGALVRLDLGELVGSELERRVYRTPVVTHLEPGVMVDADRMQIIRLLTNLVDNADRHAASTITVSVRREGDRSVLEVRDDGAGISPDQWEYVFQRFARLAAARSRDAGGTGLGLAISREIAERHGGTLTIRDSESGARFVADLPASPAPDRRDSGG